uniref:Uncharacterized protein n=1 Tax=Phlebotomus papatasi TaxID=29031 RepID=A0A1B0GQA7_PHLPP
MHVETVAEVMLREGVLHGAVLAGSAQRGDIGQKCAVQGASVNTVSHRSHPANPVEDEILDFEVDSGAICSVMAWDDYLFYFGNHSLEPCTQKLASVEGSRLITRGVCNVKVKEYYRHLQSHAICQNGLLTGRKYF